MLSKGFFSPLSLSFSGILFSLLAQIGLKIQLL
jgi:hypothetical protein